MNNQDHVSTDQRFGLGYGAGFGRPGFGRPGFGRPGFGRPGYGNRYPFGLPFLTGLAAGALLTPRPVYGYPYPPYPYPYPYPYYPYY
ncbi:spore coat protein [Bacillus suaedae]|uniref:Spore coat protein n=1 Tax=Halalkalibacter suaedae TaxID=2822140 RepID=A0A941AT59_9BACI|nr:spore coat protein [Bacillus suaedae]